MKYRCLGDERVADGAVLARLPFPVRAFLPAAWGAARVSASIRR